MRRTAPISPPSASPVTSAAAPRPVRAGPFPVHATDASPSRGTRCALPGRLSFRGHSSTWGGAPAIFEPATPKGHGGTEVFARAWRLGWDQFEDVMAQENGRATIPLDVEPAALVDGSSVLVGPGRYDRLVCVGIHEGLPVLTFTAPASLESCFRKHHRSRTWPTSLRGCARPSASSTPRSWITSGVRPARRPTSFVPLWLSEGGGGYEVDRTGGTRLYCSGAPGRGLAPPAASTISTDEHGHVDSHSHRLTAARSTRLG